MITYYCYNCGTDIGTDYEDINKWYEDSEVIMYCLDCVNFR